MENFKMLKSWCRHLILDWNEHSVPLILFLYQIVLMPRKIGYQLT